MRKVLQLLEIIEVPDDYIRCSVCGKWHEPSQYRNDDENFQSRTNCTSCHNLPYEHMKKLKEETKEFFKSYEYKNKSRKLNNLIYVSNNISTKEELIQSALEYIERLKVLPDDVLFTEFHSCEYNGIEFSKPSFGDFIKVDRNYPYEYPIEIDGKQIYYKEI